MAQAITGADTTQTAANTTNQTLTVHNGQVNVPDGSFISNAELVRDGYDLVLETPEGALVIENYFLMEPTPNIVSPDGLTLSPQLVNSFVQSTPEYAQMGTLSDVSPVGSVQEVSGEATVTRADGTIEPVTIGTPIFQGDVVETDAEGAVNIVFIDETSFAVSDNARLAIDEYVFDPVTESGESNFSVLRGVFVFTSGLIGRDDPDDVEIETPVGSIGIRGTTIAGDVDAGEITVIEGAIVLRAHNGAEMTLAEQFETAKFDMTTGEIVSMGKLSANDVGAKFSAIGKVAPVFVNSLGEDATVNETTQGEEAQEASEEAPVEEGAGNEDAATEDAPAEESVGEEAASEEAAAAEDGATDASESADATQTTTTMEQSSAGDDSLAIRTSSTETPSTGPAQTNASSDNADSFSADTTSASDNTANNTTSPFTTSDGTSTSENQQQPPNTLDGSGGGNDAAAGSTGRGGIDLEDATQVRVKQVNTNNFNAEGIAVSALGDVDNDGGLDFGFLGKGPDNIFVIDDDGASSQLGPNAAGGDFDMAALGDVDGDGKDDFIVGLSRGEAIVNGTATDSGQVYFSSGDGIIVELEDIGGGDMTSEDGFGYSVAGVGDLNQDGYADMVFSAPSGAGGAGAVYLLYGEDGLFANNIDMSNVDVALTGPGGNNSLFGQSVTGAGDMNGDGFDEVVVGAPGENKVYVYGGGDLSNTVMTVTGPGTGDQNGFGHEVIGGFDANADGKGDFVIASDYGAYVVYGGTGNLDVSALNGANGFKIFSGAGEIVSGGLAGDYNGDGHNDLAIVTSRYDGSQHINDIFVLFSDPALGPNSGGAFDIDSIMGHPARGDWLTWDGAHRGESIEVSSAGDLNGNGFDDLIIGSGEAGDVYVVHGRPSGDKQLIATADDQSLVGGKLSNTLHDNSFGGLSMRAGAGNDTLVVGDAYVDGAGLEHRVLDGGAGTNDTLKIVGNAASDVNFSKVNELRGIERIDIANGEADSLTLTTENIFDMAGDLYYDLNGSFGEAYVLKIETDATGDNIRIENLGTEWVSQDVSAIDEAGYIGYAHTSENHVLLIDANADNVQTIV